ncbi:MAG: LysR substrate-binding domain-containing protein [Bacteroidales bacterium]
MKDKRNSIVFSLTQLEYLVAVDTYRHFATAAEKCFVTQPTLSMQLKKMEEDLGVTLFDRSKQPVIPTDIGIKVIEQARVVLKEARKIDEMVNDFQGVIGGDLKIGIIPTLAPYLLPLFAGKYKKKYPGISLHVKEMITEEVIRALRKDEIDAAIVVSPLKEPGIVEEALFYEQMLIYTNKDHPLRLRENIQLTDIAKPEIWLLNDAHCFRHQVVNLCKMSDSDEQELPFEFEGGSLETLMKIIDLEGGFTLIPELATIDMTDDQYERTKHFSNFVPLREVSLIYTRSFAKTRLLELLKSEIVDNVPEKLLDKSRGSVVEWR